MTTKTFDIQYKGSQVPVLAVKLDPGCEADRLLLSRAGYGKQAREQSTYVLMMDLCSDYFRYDPYEWPLPFLRWAHLQIRSQFDLLESGSVICPDQDSRGNTVL